MDQPISRFVEARSRLLDALQRFPSRHRNDVLFDQWSLKDLVAHLTGWDQYFAAILASLQEGQEPPFWGKLREFNEASVGKRRALSWKKVHGEFVAAGDGFIRAYGELSPKTAHTKFWNGKSYTPARIIDINAHHYGESHLPEIEAMLVKLAGE
jgi:hypothetical protein